MAKKKETVEEFLARGGKIQTIEIGKANGPQFKQLKGEELRDIYRQPGHKKAKS